MFKARKARSERFQSVGYGQNEEEKPKARDNYDYSSEDDDVLPEAPPLRPESDDENLDSKKASNLPFPVEIPAYDGLGTDNKIEMLEKELREKAERSKAGQSRIAVSGRGAKLFEKQSVRMDRFTLEKGETERTRGMKHKDGQEGLKNEVQQNGVPGLNLNGAGPGASGQFGYANGAEGAADNSAWGQYQASQQQQAVTKQEETGLLTTDMGRGSLKGHGSWHVDIGNFKVKISNNNLCDLNLSFLFSCC